MHTGDTKWLSGRDESLKPKLLLERAREDGLLISNATQIKKDYIVDWPKKERDGYVFKPVNTVVNAFHIHSLGLMAKMAAALGNEKDADDYAAMANAAFQCILYNPAKGAYLDGEGTDHMSQHASQFPLAFGLVPQENIPAVVHAVQKRDMACSVCAAQYLMEALFANEARTRALELITAPTDRSWRYMLESGTTITWEAWDLKYKPNQDRNHAWGAAPANLLPRFVLGAEPLTAGWKQVRIRPQTGSLSFAKGKIPTPLGPITMQWENRPDFLMNLTLPDGMSTRLELPAPSTSKGVRINGKPVPAKHVGSRWIMDEEMSGVVSIEVIGSQEK